MLGSPHASGERLDVFKGRKRGERRGRQIGEMKTIKIICLVHRKFCVIMMSGCFRLKATEKKITIGALFR